jgi:sugar phosphate isomerase/epimerase
VTEEPPRGDRTARNAAALAAAIAELGLKCAIEARGGLVLLMPDADSVARLADDETRRAALALARQHGFTHAAIELPNDRRRVEPDPDAPVSRD